MKRIGLGLLLGLGMAVGSAPTHAVTERSTMGVLLERGGADDDVTGRADFRGGRRSQFRVRMDDGPTNATVEVFVGGISRGTFTTSRRGRGGVTYRTGSATGSSRSLDFDPRGQEIEIEDAQDDSLLRHSGDHSSNVVGSAVLEWVNLHPTGLQPAASGKARYQERRGVRKFQVEIEDVTAGDYSLLVDNVARGTITVGAGEGEIEFANPTDDPGKELLDFDPYGKLIQVTRDGGVVLTGELRAVAPGVSACAPGETVTALANVGPDPDATGEARLRVRENCRHDFQVEAEDLPVGDYDLYVANILRGTITVTNQTDGAIEGEIEFSSPVDDDGDDLPLDFDPTGAVVEIRQGATVFLSATASGVTTGSCVAVDVEPDLTNTGADVDAKGKARFRQETDCDRDFRVEIEDLPVGAYELVVGGTVRGTITVALVLGEPVGEVEFDNDPDQPGELLLTFDPRGQPVEVRQGATVFLTVTLTN